MGDFMNIRRTSFLLLSIVQLLIFIGIIDLYLEKSSAVIYMPVFLAIMSAILTVMLFILIKPE